MSGPAQAASAPDQDRVHADPAPGGVAARLTRIFAFSMVATALVFLVNNYLIFWRGWPGISPIYDAFGLSGGASGEIEIGILSWLQLGSYVIAFVAICLYVITHRQRTIHDDADLLSGFAAYIARWAFWAIVLVGLADMAISFLRVEALLASVVGEDLTTQLGRANFRGLYVHYPLIGLALVIAAFSRSLGFIWLALLVVVAELQIVIFRFVFSYEQAFMADLVRFWYAGLFLFASAYTLLHEGHVRVDILYANFSERGKAWTNSIGSVFLGAPVCWFILTRGMWEKTNVINSPLLNFEVTQSGFGMYVKYLMAGFLVVYALSMLVQFMSYFLNSVAVLLREPGSHLHKTEEAHLF